MPWKALFSAIVGLAVAFPVVAQEGPANDMEIVREEMRADKKLLVSNAMSLTESEAQGFWPVYDAYQQDQRSLNDRTLKLLEDYVAHYDSLDDARARRILDQYVAIEKDRVDLMQSYLPKFRKILPETRVARYYQIENKIRAVVDYDLAGQIPLVP